jgi:Holliday junction resolvase
MVNKNYVSGRRFEYTIKKALEKLGWIAIRSAGSHSPFDIIAIKEGRILLLQLKKYKGGHMPQAQYYKEMKKLFGLNISSVLQPTVAIIQDQEGLRKALRTSRGDDDVI